MARLFFFFNDTATTEIYTLSLHDALPISAEKALHADTLVALKMNGKPLAPPARSEEHTSELQSHVNIVCRLLLEKKERTKRTALRSLTHARKPPDALAQTPEKHISPHN